MVDANRLPQVLAGSRADRLKRPIDAAGVWLRISRSNGIPEFPVRRDELTEELTPVSTLATTALQTAESKLDAGQVLTLLNGAFAELFQEYPLVGGMEHREVDPTDNREYRYTIFAIQTRYAGTFEELALVSNDVNETLLDIEYGTYKESPGRIILVFRDMDEGFADGIAKIKLAGVPTLNTAPAGISTERTNNESITITPGAVSVAANDLITVTFANFNPANLYSSGGYFNDAEFRAFSDLLPSDIGTNNVIQINANVFAGQPLPGPLQIAGGATDGAWSVASNVITVNP